MIVLLPAMFGPVMMWMRSLASKCVSFGTNRSPVSIRSTTGCRPSQMVSTSSSLSFGRT